MRKTKQTRGFKTNQLSTPRIESVERRLLMSTYTVNTLSDAITPVMGQLTLRQAVADANSNPGSDTIAFSPAVFTPGTLHTVTLTQGELLVTGNTTFNGPGSSVLAVSGDSASRVFQISSGVSVSISGMTITDGSVVSAAGTLALGGAVLNAGTLNLTGVTVSNSSALGGDFDRTLDDYLSTAGSASGGGIFSTGTLSLTNSTVTGDTARGGASFYGYDGNSSGGGIYSAGPLTIPALRFQATLPPAGLRTLLKMATGVNRMAAAFM